MSDRVNMLAVATELEWLRWYRKNAPGWYLADDAVERVDRWLREDFEKEMKKKCPENF